MQAEILLVDEELHVQPVEAAIDVPVDVAEVVAHPVGAVVAELDAVPQRWLTLAPHPAAKHGAKQREALKLAEIRVKKFGARPASSARPGWK
jgi:hypothetical protein